MSDECDKTIEQYLDEMHFLDENGNKINGKNSQWIQWIPIKQKDADLDIVHFLTDGENIYIKGTKSRPFLFQITGSLKPMGDINFSHWMPLPTPPEET